MANNILPITSSDVENINIVIKKKKCFCGLNEERLIDLSRRVSVCSVLGIVNYFFVASYLVSDKEFTYDGFEIYFKCVIALTIAASVTTCIEGVWLKCVKKEDFGLFCDD